MVSSLLPEKALTFATAKHGGQKRMFTGEPYMVHPMAVADLVKSTGAPEYVVAAAVLHDVLEDTPCTYDELVAAFGAPVADLVVEVTNVYRSGDGEPRAVRKAKEQARLAKISAHAMTIKVADIIDNCASIEDRAPAKFAKLYVAEKAALLKVLTAAHPALLAKAHAIEALT